MKSSFPALSTPVTWMPAAAASCRANMPVPPPAPLSSIRSPAFARPTACRAIAPACGSRGRLGEGQLGRLQRQRRLRCHGVLGEAAHVGEVVSVDLIAHREARHTGAHGGDAPRDVRAEDAPSRSGQPTEAGVHRGAPQSLPIAEVHGGRDDLDENLAPARRGCRDLLDPQLVGHPVAVVHDGLHINPPFPRRCGRALASAYGSLCLLSQGRRPEALSPALDDHARGTTPT